EGPFRNHPDIFAGITVHLLMLATMCPDIVFARLPVILTCGIVTALLGFILIKIEFHSHPLSVGSHAKKGIGYPMRVLISIVPSYTTRSSISTPMCRAGTSVRWRVRSIRWWQ